MAMVDLISKKRQGKVHSKEELQFIVDFVMNKEAYRDYQMAAWLMAVCWQGLNMDETAYLTDALARSGQMLDLSAIGSVVGDKHSTGGVGDKTTLVFVPMLAAAGIPMAKLSGRGLGHTGGTLDKLEAIPGFNVNLSMEQFIAQVRDIGAAIGGQTADLAPADGIIYALRDVTATVESVPLVAASVMCKKIVSGANFIILDVKCGRGALMENEERAIVLATTMAEVGKRLKRPVSAVVTDMEQPLGNAVGHTVEVIEAIETLKGNGPEDLQELCYSLGALSMVAAGKAADENQARTLLKEIIESGKALAKFKELIVSQGGNPKVIEDYTLMPQSKIKHAVKLGGSKTQWIAGLDGKLVAGVCQFMGASRAKKGDPINMAVGVVMAAKIGSSLNPGDTIATIHADSQEQAVQAEAKLREAITFSDREVEKPTVIKARIS